MELVFLVHAFSLRAAHVPGRNGLWSELAAQHVNAIVVHWLKCARRVDSTQNTRCKRWQIGVGEDEEREAAKRARCRACRPGRWSVPHPSAVCYFSTRYLSTPWPSYKLGKFAIVISILDTSPLLWYFQRNSSFCLANKTSLGVSVSRTIC
jgi:hypothetical protein